MGQEVLDRVARRGPEEPRRSGGAVGSGREVVVDHGERRLLRRVELAKRVLVPGESAVATVYARA